MKTRVIHWRDRHQYDPEPDELVYIGRAMPRLGLKASIWANYYRIGQDGTREEVIAKYRTYLEAELMADGGLADDLAELSGHILACWCKPAACHGDVLAELADQIAAAKRAEQDYYAELADAASY
jgi:hypothetical protein